MSMPTGICVSLVRMFVILVVAGIVFTGCMSTKASPIKSDEHIVFFDTAAWQDHDGTHWIIPIHGWIYEPENSSVRKAIAAWILKRRFGVKTTEDTRQNFNDRINLFLVDNEHNKRIALRLGENRYLMLPSELNGHFYGKLVLPLAHVEKLTRDDRLAYAAILSADDWRRFTGRVHLISPRGRSVISDIDDTIKITHVANRTKLLDYTLFRDFTAVPGMAKLYRTWGQQGVAFHFVSSGPWQLYETLRAFTVQEGFPAATFHLKSVRLADETIWNLFKKSIETKPAQIEPLLQTYPGRRYILVGDSGEQDPEVYAAMFRKYPAQIERIFIRNVTNASPTDERFKQTFAGISPDKWQLFTDPATLELPE